MLAHLKSIAIVGLGGGIGAMLRVIVTLTLPEIAAPIPLKIIIVNIAGCFVMGFLAKGIGLYWSLPAPFQTFLTTGILGGFTTFSAFSLEFGLLVEKHQPVSAAFYLTATLVGTIGAFFLGMAICSYFNSVVFG